jgi:hypothetical protein
MAANFFDRKPSSWQELEEMVHQAFTEMGYLSNRAHKLNTIRGTVELDIHYAGRIEPRGCADETLSAPRWLSCQRLKLSASSISGFSHL